MKIKITSDSTVDIPAELREKYGISVMPLQVLLGSELFSDGVDVDPPKIYDYVARTGELPKTTARNAEEYKAFFRSQLDEGYDAVIHYALSSGCSATCGEAKRAAEDMDGIYVVDSLALSTGTALLAIDGAEQAALGASAETIVGRSLARVPCVQTSFIIDELNYLHKGGRCSRVAMFGANLLKIKPTIEMHDGKLDVAKKYRGSLINLVPKYIDSIFEEYPTPDLKRIFVTHTAMDDAIVQEAIRAVKARFPFEEVIETVAGSTISSHCGPGTIGILYLNDGGKV